MLQKTVSVQLIMPKFFSHNAYCAPTHAPRALVQPPIVHLATLLEHTVMLSQIANVLVPKGSLMMVCLLLANHVEMDV